MSMINKNKKGIELSLNVLVIVAILVLVLIVVIFIFVRQMGAQNTIVGNLTDDVGNAATNEGGARNFFNRFTSDGNNGNFVPLLIPFYKKKKKNE